MLVSTWRVAASLHQAIAFALPVGVEALLFLVTSCTPCRRWPAQTSLDERQGELQRSVQAVEVLSGPAVSPIPVLPLRPRILREANPAGAVIEVSQGVSRSDSHVARMTA